MYNGIINIYKEKDFTSHDVVAKLRGILKQKKIGHTGTLDPDATGVLPVCLGKGTKLCDMLTEKDKTYKTVFVLGMTTDTQDISGEVLSESLEYKNLTKQQIKDVINSFVGEYNQIPPMYSALKVNGKKLYELAREGIVVERKARQVYIHDINIIDISEDNKLVTMEVSCSKGTYIRTLCHDIGQNLACGACMKELTRTKVSSFDIDNAITLKQVEEYVRESTIDKYIYPLEDVFLEYPKLVLNSNLMKFLVNGNKISENDIKKCKFFEGVIDKENSLQGMKSNQNWIRVYTDDEKFYAIYEHDENKKEYKPVKMFGLEG